MTYGMDARASGPVAPDGALLLGNLWERIYANGDSPRPVELSPAAPFDTTALRWLVERRETLGRPGSWAVREYIEDMRCIRAWETGVMPGANRDAPVRAAWVMLHGQGNPERSSQHSVYRRPNLIFLVSGYLAARRTCSAVQLIISPMQQIAEGERGADEEFVVTGSEHLVPRSLTPPDGQELSVLRSLGRAVHGVLNPFLPAAIPVRMGPGVYRSFSSQDTPPSL